MVFEVGKILSLSIRKGVNDQVAMPRIRRTLVNLQVSHLKNGVTLASIILVQDPSCRPPSKANGPALRVKELGTGSVFIIRMADVLLRR